MRFKKQLSILFINISVLLFSIFAVEFISRKFENRDIVNQDKKNSKRLIAYKNFEDQFDLLSDDCNRNYFIVSDGEDIKFVDKNFNCPGVTVRDGKRITLPLTQNQEKNIHIFGGSTVFGTGSIDSYTIPSLLQKKINEITNKKIKVVNHGFASLVTKQQLRNLQISNINKNDIVIFYDGGNDAFLSYIYENMEGSIVGFNKANRIPFLLSRVRFLLSKNSSFYRLLSNLKKSKPSNSNSIFCGPNFNQEKADKYIANYLANLNLAKDYSDAKGAKFVHFLQPVLGSGGQLKEDNYYPKILLSDVKSNSNQDFNKCLINRISRYYKYKSDKYRDSNNKFAKNDLSFILSKGEKPESHYFLDHIHISPKGNMIISDAIFSRILPMIK